MKVYGQKKRRPFGSPFLNGIWYYLITTDLVAEYEPAVTL
jgi:hypothetical protein